MIFTLIDCDKFHQTKRERHGYYDKNETTIRLNDNAWEIIIDVLDQFGELEVVQVRNAIGRKVFPDDDEFRRKPHNR